MVETVPNISFMHLIHLLIDNTSIYYRLDEVIFYPIYRLLQNAEVMWIVCTYWDVEPLIKLRLYREMIWFHFSLGCLTNQ